MLKTVAAALLVSALSIGSAFAKDVPAASDTGAQAFLKAVKACLVEAKVPVSGDRPGCYMNADMRVMCLGPYKEAGHRCAEEAQSKPKNQGTW